jgi:hypothetical protein
VARPAYLPVVRHEEPGQGRRGSGLGRFLLAGVAVLGLETACRSAGGPPPASVPGPLADAGRALVGQQRILRFDGRKKTVSVKMEDYARAPTPCDVAVEVKSAVFSDGSARFSLQPIGQPRLTDQAREGTGKKSSCRELPAEVALTISGLRGTSVEALTSEVSKVLLTVEGYLHAHGIRFDRPAGTEPKEVADPTPTAGGEAQRLARSVTAAPRRLLAIDPVDRSSDRKPRYEGLVELDAVVGVDGRLHRARLTTALGDHEERALRVLPLWRYEPARVGEQPIAMRVNDQLIFRIF